MGTTTEPPYLHKSSGVAPRNGTSTHVINFTTDGDAPFTPASGSLLVLFVFGAVTHTNGVWAERFQPVATAELSLFEITSAPTTSITITHNGSNYPVDWCVYELPAGTTYDTGVQAPLLPGGANTTDVFPTLPGLTGGAGNERLVLAAKGRALTSSGSSLAAATTWGGSFVEDCELNVANVGNEGVSLTTAHLINTTATSVTPSATSTWTTDASWAPDREYIVAAYNAVAPSSTTPVSGTLDLRWKTYNTVTGSTDLRWRVYNTVSGSTDLRWRVYNAIAATNALDLRWAVLNAIAGSLDLRWRVANVVNGTLDLRWAVRNSIAGTLDLRWLVYNAVTGSLDLRWISADSGAVTTPVSGTLDLRWKTFAPVSGALDLRWAVRNSVSGSIALQWAVLNAVAGTLDLRWAVRNQISGSLGLLWVSWGHVSGQLVLIWVVNSDVRRVSDIQAVLGERVTARLDASNVIYRGGL